MGLLLYLTDGCLCRSYTCIHNPERITQEEDITGERKETGSHPT